MVLWGSRPWLASWIIHGIVLFLLVVGLLPTLLQHPSVVSMHLVVTGDSENSGTHRELSSPRWKAAEAAPRQREEPPQPHSTSTMPTVPIPRNLPQVSSSLDELLPPDESAPLDAATSQTLTEGWGSSTGVGYSPPPLPPPSLSPPQGATWTLIIHVPGAGGYASAIEGLESGHPELDRWLSTYLRTISFPSSLDGQAFTLHWSLRLRTERPQ